MFRRIVCLVLVLAMLSGFAFSEDDPFANVGEVGDAVSTGDIYAAVGDESISNLTVLRRGDRDEDDGVAAIVMLQNRLIALGFLRDAADGVYGENTERAVREFQRLNQLTETGVADQTTQKLIYSDMSTLVLPSEDNAVDYGTDTYRVQNFLAQSGFLSGSVDGVMGPGSRTAVAKFKNYIDKYVPVTPSPVPTATPSPTPAPTLAPGELPDADDVPIATPSLEELIENSEVDALVMSYVNGESRFEVYRRPVQNGDTGDEVNRVQTRLKQLGYLYPDPDGVFGSSTELALKYFQKKHNLMETGIADEATQRAMFAADARRAEEYVFPYKIIVDISEQRVHVYKWDGSAYSKEVQKFVCSTGKDDTPTPKGTYQSYGQMADEWFYFSKYNCYARWAYGIVGGILFHSITYNSSKKQVGSESSLGRKASHGCVRLKVVDAKWIYDNCPTGTTVVIQD